MSGELPVWRSLLYVPANVEKYVEKCHTYGADCVQLDLEDSVPCAEKAQARKLIERAAARLRERGIDVVVRINRPLGMAVRDIEAAVGPAVNGLSIPKVQSAAHLQLLDELVADLEEMRGLAAGHTRFIALIETAEAFFEMPKIAKSTKRLAGMALGSEDLALEVGMRPTEETLLMAKQQMIFAAATAGLLPLGFIASASSYGDVEAFRRMVRRSREFGFAGAGCIHPSQIPIVNEAYTPSEEEVAEARRIVAAGKMAESAGRGSLAIDGHMIDGPIKLRAQRLLERHAAIQAREARSHSPA
jgi:citrate lyase subunit beta / citryl-CoA lyase